MSPRYSAFAGSGAAKRRAASAPSFRVRDDPSGMGCRGGGFTVDEADLARASMARKPV